MNLGIMKARLAGSYSRSAIRAILHYILPVAAVITCLLCMYYDHVPGRHNSLTISTASTIKSNDRGRSENNSSSLAGNKAMSRLELFLPVAPTSEGIAELAQFFLPSLALFWPQQYLKLLVITDGEAQSAANFSEQPILDLANHSLLSNVRVSFNYLSGIAIVRGWDRQQWLMFWADNFTSEDYVGFVDSDAVFVTRVTPYDLFADGKPIVRSLFGKPYDPNWWPQASKSTMAAVGRREPFNCMSFFPVVIKTEHLAPIREHIRQTMNAATFNDAFLVISQRTIYSQFSIMCAYLWYYKRDDYFWIVGEREHGWKGPFVAEQAQNYSDAEINEEMLFRQRPHLAVHWNYETFKDEPNAMQTVFRTGVCYSMAQACFPKRPSFCQNLRRFTEINRYEWVFEGYDLSTNRSLGAHLERLRHIDSECPTNWLDKKFDF